MLRSLKRNGKKSFQTKLTKDTNEVWRALFKNSHTMNTKPCGPTSIVEPPGEGTSTILIHNKRSDTWERLTFPRGGSFEAVEAL